MDIDSPSTAAKFHLKAFSTANQTGLRYPVVMQSSLGGFQVASAKGKKRQPHVSLSLFFLPICFYIHTFMAAIVHRLVFSSPNLRQTLSKNGCSWHSRLAWNV